MLVVLTAAAAAARLPLVFRGITYDEAITLLETSGHAAPVWPDEPALAGASKAQLRGVATFREIADGLRATDVHPPLYFWSLAVWKDRFGASIETARILSLLFSLGAVWALFLLLRAAGAERPLIPTTVYAFSSGAMISATLARGYALASLLVLAQALFAYLAGLALDRSRNRAATYSAAMALCFGAAFYTSYLTVFPCAAILLWYLLSNWRRWRTAAAAFPLLAISLALALSPAVSQLSARRPHQYQGFPGVFGQVKQLVLMNVDTIFPPLSPRPLHYAAALVAAALIAIAAYAVGRDWKAENRPLWALWAGLACAPSLGVAALNLFFDKNISEPRYVVFAGPALAVFVAHPIVRLVSRSLPLAALALAGVAVMQIVGAETYVLRQESTVRALARTINHSHGPSQVVVMDVGWGRGHPGTLVYELDPRIRIVSLSPDTDPERLLSRIQSYEDVWVVFFTDPITDRARREFRSRLLRSESYRPLFQTASMSRFRRIDR